MCCICFMLCCLPQSLPPSESGEFCSSTGLPVWKSLETRLQWWVKSAITKVQNRHIVNNAQKKENKIQNWFLCQDDLSLNPVIYLSVFLCIHRLQPIYSHDWRGHPLTKTGMFVSTRITLICYWHCRFVFIFCCVMHQRPPLTLTILFYCGWKSECWDTLSDNDWQRLHLLYTLYK